MNAEQWAIIDHEKAIKAAEGLIAYFYQNERSRGKSGGWRRKTYAVTVLFSDGDRTLIQYESGQKRIVKTADLEKA